MTYRSHADLGGQQGFGAVRPEPEEQRFHAAWEAHALAVSLAMGATGAWNLDMSRAARETLANYAELSYYEIWTAALEALLHERDLVSPDEIETGRMTQPARTVQRVLGASAVAASLALGTSTARDATTAARFAPGQRVRTRADAVPHHTRLPAYVRARRGVVGRIHGVFVFPDSNAQGLGEAPQWLYSIAFEEHELWVDDVPHQGLTVCVDAWESYLEAA